MRDAILAGLAVEIAKQAFRRARPRTWSVDGELHSHFLTFRICHLVVQGLVPRLDARADLALTRMNSSLVSMVWPPSGEVVKWPPKQSLREDEIAEFADAFLNDGGSTEGLLAMPG